jgi:hypothetical protein
MARIVGGVVNRRYRCEAHQVNESQPEKERERSNDSPILRQGCGARFGQCGGCHDIPVMPFGRAGS